MQYVYLVNIFLIFEHKYLPNIFFANAAMVNNEKVWLIESVQNCFAGFHFDDICKQLS